MFRSAILFLLCSSIFLFTFSPTSAELSAAENVVSIGLTAHGAHTFNHISNHFNNYESLVNQLKEGIAVFDNAKINNLEPKLPQNLLHNLQKSAIEYAQSNKGPSSLDVQSAIEKAFDKKSSSDTTLELKDLISKLDKDMLNQWERVLRFELTKSATKTSMMVRDLLNTNSLIKNSQQFRESSKIQETTKRTQEYLDKAETYYQVAINEINRIEKNRDTHIQPNTLNEIIFNLNSAKIESDWAKRELDGIIAEMNSKLESLEAAKNKHLRNIFCSFLDFLFTIYEILRTPQVIWTKGIQLLFGAKAGLDVINIVGNANGFYWTQEEIAQLNKCQTQLEPLQTEIQDSFNRINYGREKLEKIKQFS